MAQPDANGWYSDEEVVTPQPRKQYNNNRNNYERNNDRGAREGGGGYAPRNDNQPREVMEVDPDKIKFIIGRAGSKIQEIQHDCNVRVTIDKQLNDNGSNNVTITGTVEDIGYAKDMITSAINFKPKERNNVRSNPAPTQRPAFESEDGIIDWDAVNRDCEAARKERWGKCPPMIKNFYKEDPTVANFSEEEVKRWRDSNNNIVVDRTFKDQAATSDPIPNPVQTFEQALSCWPDMLEEVKKQGFTKPSPIQSQAWPVLFKGEDLIGIAQTGTGKTLAFLLPGMVHTDLQPVSREERGGPNVLVMAPTRELALQIKQEVDKYQFRGIKAVCLYGGGERKAQIESCNSGVQIIICTPGRLNDLCQAGVIDITSVTYLVLDEADRMLDMGFEPQIRKLLLDIRPDRQTVMTSATWPPGVRRLAQSYMKNPIQVCVGSLDLAATHTVSQLIEIVEEDDKTDRIFDFVRNMTPTEKCIIFCGRKTRADDLSSEFALKGVLCQSIHGNRDQADREQALADIKSGEVQILVATDVASRGLDIEDITHVINFDFPNNIEEYVHRVGRTGRAGKTGTSISFFTRKDWGSADELIVILEEADQDVPEELREMGRRFRAMKDRQANEKDMYGFGGRGGGGRGRGRGGSGHDNSDNWTCSSCSGSNFARRTECFKCQKPKSGGSNGFGGGGGGGGGGRRGGSGGFGGGGGRSRY